MSKKDFKYLIIGSGPAGTAAALTLARAKKNVAIVEGRLYGGANINLLDVPYSTALDFAHSYAKVRAYPELTCPDFGLDISSIPARQLSAIIGTGGNNKQPLEEAGVICLDGYANFLDPHTVAINQKKFSSDYFILATGAHPKLPNISSLDAVKYLTPYSAIRVRRSPGVVAVVGGGSTGCELAEYLAELGSQVIILEKSNRILPREDTEVSQVISDYFTDMLGITVLPGSQVTAIEQDSVSKRVIFKCNESDKAIRVDTIVFATGSEPTLNYGLKKAGVKFKKTGIPVNKSFQTSAKHIYAIGDCLGLDSSTDRATYEGTCLATNLIGGNKTTPNFSGIIRTTNTYPEVAVIGLNEVDLTRMHRKCRKAIIEFDTIPAGKIYHFSYGFVKLLADRNRHIIGASIVAPEANLMATEISLAIRHNLTALELASTPHLANHFNEAIRIAARRILRKKY